MKLTGTGCVPIGGRPAYALVTLVTYSGTIVASGSAAPTAAGAWKAQFTVPPATAPGNYDVDGTCDTYNGQQAYPEQALKVTAAAASTWAQQATPAPHAPNGSLSAISCVRATTTCLAVGTTVNPAGGEVPLAERYNGHAWVVTPIAAPADAEYSSLVALSCASTTLCMAVGNYTNGSGLVVPLAEQWNGARWTATAAVNPDGYQFDMLTGVACPSTTLCRAVGTETSFTPYKQNSLAEQWNGSKWTVVATPNSDTDTLTAIACPSVSLCMVVGANADDSPLAVEWTGTSFTSLSPVSSPGAYSNEFSVVSCATTTHCMAVGTYLNKNFDTETLAEQWYGQTWRIRPTPKTPSTDQGVSITGVACPAPTSCTAVGYDTSYNNGVQDSTPIVQAWNGHTWSARHLAASAGSRDALSGVSCLSLMACITVGSYETPSENPFAEFNYNSFSLGEAPLAEISSGRTWTVLATIDPRGVEYSSLSGVSCPATNDCLAVGEITTDAPAGSPIPLAEHWNGAVWTALAPPIPTGTDVSPLYAVSCPTTNDCVAVGVTDSGSDFRDSSAYADTWNGHTWTTTTLPKPAGIVETDLSAVSCPAPGTCFAVGTASDPDGNPYLLVARLAGGSWSDRTLDEPVGAQNPQLSGVSCPTTRSCTAVGTYADIGDGTSEILVETFNGAGWRHVAIALPASATGAALSAVSCVAATSCTAVGTRVTPFSNAVGDTTLAEVLSGTKWTVQLTASGPYGGVLTGVSCTSAQACTAVGQAYGYDPGESNIVETQHGASWIEATTPNPGATFNGGSSLAATACLGATACVAVGGEIPGIEIPFAIAQNGA